MNDFGLIEMQEIQKQLQEKYKDKWGGLSPDKGRNQLLWMMIEVGEVCHIIKKVIITLLMMKRQEIIL